VRVPSSYTVSSDRADAAMTPMIDVVFLLLIFFVWTSSFQAIETLLPSQLSARGDAGQGADLPQEDFERIVIRLLPGQEVRWELNGQAISSLTELAQRLAQLAAIKVDLPVVIEPAQEIAFGDVIDVYDVSLGAGLVNIQFTTRAELPGS
jgi:biopolymer transport protein ExbD